MQSSGHDGLVPKEIVWRPVGQLDLDKDNPRIAVSPTISQPELIDYMYRNEALQELAASLARNGFFAEEPLVIVPASQSPRFVVIEGNRRVATLKILLDETNRERLRIKDWPVLSAEQIRRVEQVPTVIYESRADVLPYLGFRHITGNKTWEPLAKARYIANLVATGGSLSGVAASIGDVAGTVRRLYQSYVVYQQIGRDVGMDDRLVSGSFSLLQVVLAQGPIKTFLGIPRTLPSDRVDVIVPDNRLEQLREVISWVFGDPEQGQDRVLTDSRLISQRLAPVIANSESLEYLRRHRDLEAAYEYSGGELQYYRKQLRSASRALKRALSVAPLHRQDPDASREVDEIVTILAAIREQIGQHSPQYHKGA
jgi:hypothetical protein